MFIFAIIFFSACYKFYGSFMVKSFKLDNSKDSPAVALYDGMDYCPTHPAVLMGHHFSSIAGAGPVVGPITAAGMFGWLPAYLWCLIGSAFLGGPHDAGSLIASIRHEGKSVGVVVERWIGHRGKNLFLSFTILTLILVVAVFLQLAANTMSADPAVAFSACLYMLMAVIFGILVYRFKISIWPVTLVMVPIILGSCWFATVNPWIAEPFKLSMPVWRWILVGYIMFASVLPVWLLLQPRDYLASYFLYFAVLVGAIGMIFGRGFEIYLPAYKTMAAGANADQYMWPMLFVVVACGAISGFHSLVGSGTTSKQLRKETDSVLVGYGSMLLEGLVAVMAIGTIMITEKIAPGGPVITYAEGFGRFAALIGIDTKIGVSMGALAVNSFILTSLDTATRLGRYQIQEFTNYKLDKYTSTIIPVIGAVALLMVNTTGADGKPIPAWSAIWPVFGSANQLVAALAFLAVAVWVRKGLNKNATFLMAPMWFMLVTTLAALVLLIRDQFTSVAQPNYLLVVVSVLLMVLAVMMVKEALLALKKEAPGEVLGTM
ncbi:MAG: carbon starvation protein A [Synergistaceae bacterium]|jgi:carbon starvation protein|nr:carbon starvation protein A [Synergistaceae bacterium]